MKNLIEISHGFDLTVSTKNCTLEDKMVLCNAFDGYELREGVKDLALVDVMAIEKDEFHLKVTLKQPLTYIEIGSYILGMVEHAKSQLGRNMELEPVSIRWNLSTFGAESDVLDERLLAASPLRGELLNHFNLKLDSEKKKKGESKYSSVELGSLYLIK